MTAAIRLTQRLAEAFALAVRLHGADTRKGKDTPYLAHLMTVCALVLEDGGTEEEAVAALLHDALEDHPESISPGALEQEFGPAVCRIVAGCTDTPPGFRGGRKPPWRDRKTAYLSHLRTAPADVRRVALADKVHNLQELLTDLERSDPARVWSRFNAGPSDQIWFYRQVGAVLREAGQEGALMKTYERALAELEAYHP